MYSMSLNALSSVRPWHVALDMWALYSVSSWLLDQGKPSGLIFNYFLWLGFLFFVCAVFLRWFVLLAYGKCLSLVFVGAVLAEQWAALRITVVFSMAGLGEFAMAAVCCVSLAVSLMHMRAAALSAPVREKLSREEHQC